MEDFKIYTKTGDAGTTSLLGGKRVPKYHDRIESYGTVDELISYIGLIRDQDISNIHKDFLLWIQDRLMVVAAILAADCENCEHKVPELPDSDIVKIEEMIDRLEKELPKLDSFILPGGHTIVSFTHIARNVCRRAERLSIKVNETTNCCQTAVKLLNRLSDYLFVLARKIGKEKKIEEIKWKNIV
jgi:cob(I)alamin adenosyltransferase